MTKTINDIPYAAGQLPFLGHGLHIFNDPDAFFAKNRADRDVVRCKIQGKDTLYVLDKDNINDVHKHSKHLTTKFANTEVSGKLFNTDVERTRDSYHEQLDIVRGNLIQNSAIDEQITRIADNVQHRIPRIESSTHKNRNDLYDFTGKLLFDTSAQTIFYKSFPDGLYDDFKRFDTNTPLIAGGLPSLFWRKAWKSRQRILETFSTLNISDALPFVSKQHEFFEGVGLPKEYLTTHNLGFLWAATSNTINIIFWIVATLTKNPQALDAVLDEMEACSGEFTRKSLQEMKVLNSVIYECLRFYGGGLAMRDVIEPFEITLITGDILQLKKGDRVGTYSRLNHFDRRYFNDPHQFQYDRFINGIDPQILAPWGGGSNICPGRKLAIVEFKIIIYYLLQRFQFSSNDELPKADASRLLLGSSPPTSTFSVTISQRHAA